MDYDIIYTHSLPSEQTVPEKREVLRYMGHRGEVSSEVEVLIDSLLPPTLQKARLKSAFAVKKADVSGETIKIGSMEIQSKNLAKNLGGCESVIMFALTCGAEIDRLIGAKSSIAPSQALTVSAIATALCEKYADALCTELKAHFAKSGFYLRPRFSPGYGDFALEHQKDFIAQTDASRRCGINLTDTLMLTPSKSVTGIIGISKRDDDCPPAGCEVCTKKDCKYRR